MKSIYHFIYYIVVLFSIGTYAHSIPLLTSNELSVIKSNTKYNNDPFEEYNRNVFRMNMQLDMLIIRPATIWYLDNIPDPIQDGTSDFFNNLHDFITLGNDVLQFNWMDSMHNFMRVTINSTLGILGLIDISSSIGLNSHKNSFGTTMKVYGWQHSSYFIIPLLGPSTVRDTIGLIPDTYFNPIWYTLNNQYISVGLYSINAIDTRSKYLETDKILVTSLDQYITMRDFYLQAIGESATQANPNDVSIDDLLK
ncbi:MAG: VacJ family lipoprotein [Burkholderiales bacterium]|nr:VacJ family lipoprotein [Burkholderiales bacterium]